MNPLRSFLPAVSAAGLLALSAAASAQTQTYASKTRTIRAAVLLLDADRNGGAYGQTAAPFAFQNLDHASGIKPGGWTFVNPYAPGTVTDEIVARYGQNEFNDAARTPAPGTLIAKSYAPYWTMSLTQLSDAQMGNYDVLLIAPRYFFSLNPAEREKLRRFVDGGGVLWVDTKSAVPLPPHEAENLPLAIGAGTAAGNDALSDPTSPLLNGPRKVTGNDLTLLNRTGGVLGPITNVPANDVPLQAEFGRYQGAAWVGNGQNNAYSPVIASARLGDGAIVVTTRGAAQYLSQGVTEGAITPDYNRGFRNLAEINAKPLGLSGRAAARLAVNIVSMGSGFSQTAGGTRKSSSVAADPGAPVLTRFTAEGTYGPNDAVKAGIPVGAPVTYKGFLVASIQDPGSGNYRVVVFDAVPGRDLDGDGDPDDGIVNAGGAVQDAWRDTSIGKSLDVVWMSAPFNGPISAPVCAEAPESPIGDYVLVVDNTGRLNGFQLTAKVQQRLIGGADHSPILRVQPPDGNSYVNVDGTINPPTVYDGVAYVADAVPGPTTTPVGRVWAVKLDRKGDGTNDYIVSPPANPTDSGRWYVGGTTFTSGTTLPAFTASPTIGYIPIQDSAGGADRVMYVPGVVNASPQPAFVSLWLGAKGEKPFSVQVSGNTMTLTTRASTRGQLPIYNPTGTLNAIEARLKPHISVVDQFGNPATNDVIDRATPPVGGDTGALIYNLRQTFATQEDWDRANYSVRIDYAIDWGRDPRNLSGNIVRGRIILPVQKTPTQDATARILGPIALTPRGTLHLTEGRLPSADPTNTGSQTYWAFREDMGYGAFRCVTKYALTSQYAQTFGTLAGTNVPPTFGDEDAVQVVVQDALQKAGIPVTNFNVFTDFRFSGGVSIRNGIAYVGINALRNKAAGIPIPVGIVAAFRAEPETPELRIGTTLGANPRITQADFSRTLQGVAGRTPTTSTLAGANLNVDNDNGIVRIESLAVAQREEINDAISLSQPIGIGADARPLSYRNPDAEGDRWSPLLWYALWNGAAFKGAPLVAGSELFLAADTNLPNILNNKGFGTSGVVWGVDADLSPTDAFAKAVPSRPWMVQALQLKYNSPLDVQASPHFRMPQNQGVTTFDQWKVRLDQTVLGNSANAFGVAGGEGTVVAWGNQGLYGMSRADFLVADEGRLLRVDSSGNPSASVFANRFSGIGNGGGAAEMRSLVRPVRAYPVGENDTLVVDAGGARVVLIDQDGAALRTLDGFILDPSSSFRPAGFQANDPLTFNDPRDAATYEGYVYLNGQPTVSNQSPVEYWVRYIVADSGNGRIVEMADRYTVDANTGRIGAPVQVNGEAQVGVLTWQSPSLQGAARIGTYYNSISRVYIGSLGTGRYVYVAGVSKSRATRSSAGLDNPNNTTRPSGTGGGAIVVFDPQGGTRVFDRFGMPDMSGVRFLNRGVNGYNSADQNGASYTTGLPANTPPQNNRPFTGLVAVTAQTYVENGVAYIRAMATDADAVYEFTISSAVLGNPGQDPTRDPNDATGATSLAPSWMLNEAAYTSLRAGNGNASDANARLFRPMYARRLDSGEVLVVNGYRGLTIDGNPFTGDVSLISGLGRNTQTNLGFTSSSLRFELPPLTGARGIVSPVFADRR